MSYIDPNQLNQSTVFSIYAEKDEIKVDPVYQRNGDVWTLEKKQLLIDSLINRYDIPKIYFHKFSRKDYASSGIKYAIIDGRQRLETIWKFIDGEFALRDDITFLHDPEVKLGGLTYNDLSSKHPKIKNRFDATDLPIITIETDDIELIEDMFSRLNEASPLNAAEKRNALGGYMVQAINKIEKSPLFTKKVKFSNKRYQHKEAAARLLFLQHCKLNEPRLYDTKKVYLDDFVKKFKNKEKSYVSKLTNICLETISKLEKIFINKDPLLSAQSSLPIFYLSINKIENIKSTIRLTRTKIKSFNKLREENRLIASENMTEADFDLLEFDRMSQQGTNDASSIRDRVQIFSSKIMNIEEN